MEETKKRRGRPNINPVDIVGKTFGTYKVLKYNGFRLIRNKKNGIRYINHYYEVECTGCGCRKNMLRAWIVDERYKKCRKCYVSEDMTQKTSEAKRKLDKPYKSNNSTRVKHYSVARCTSNGVFIGYNHSVSCVIDGKRYFVVNKRLKEVVPVEEYIMLAREMNKKLAEGKEEFLKWYENTVQNVKSS